MKKLTLDDFTEANLRKWMLEGTTVWWALKDGFWKFHHAYKKDVYDKVFPITHGTANILTYSRKLSKAELSKIERIGSRRLNAPQWAPQGRYEDGVNDSISIEQKC